MRLLKAADDLTAAEGHQVYADPAGHPFCLGWGHPDDEAIRRFLSEAVIDDPRWIGASTGATADAAALVVAAWPVERFSAELDAVMTALLNCALSGGSNTKAAAVILFHTLAQLGARGVRSCKSPAGSWNEKLRRLAALVRPAVVYGMNTLSLSGRL